MRYVKIPFLLDTDVERILEALFSTIPFAVSSQYFSQKDSTLHLTFADSCYIPECLKKFETTFNNDLVKQLNDKLEELAYFKFIEAKPENDE